jgi:hypothetical protein
MKQKPLCIDVFCGVGGWAEGFLAEGWDIIGFDIERHIYGPHSYPGQLVIQDALTLHGSQFKTAHCLVMSPPCQFFSYTAMPWSKAKALAKQVKADPARLEKELALFNACFRIQREASQAAGHHIPMVVENVKGAQPWVGRARWLFGSFALWGDVPALMPITLNNRMKSQISCAPRRFSDRIASTPEEAHALHYKLPGFRFDGSGGSFQSASVKRSRCDCQHPETTPSGFAAISMDCPIHGDVDCGPTITTVFPSPDTIKVPSLDGGRRTDLGKGARFTTRDCGLEAGIKQGGDWFNQSQPSISRMTSSKSPARKMASAMIAKIPETLSRHVARTFYPK